MKWEELQMVYSKFKTASKWRGKKSLNVVMKSAYVRSGHILGVTYCSYVVRMLLCFVLLLLFYSVKLQWFIWSPLHEENYSACRNSCITSSVAPEKRRKVKRLYSKPTVHKFCFEVLVVFLSTSILLYYRNLFKCDLSLPHSIYLTAIFAGYFAAN